jgi:protein-S-isoprenylcysteine O-methyltransferase Ste14
VASEAKPSWIVRIPPPIWTLAMLIIAYALQRNAIDLAIHVIQSTSLAIAFIVAGIALAIWGERSFAAAGTEIMPASATNKKLVTSGPFRFTRNPMYLGLILASLGVAFYFGTLPFFVVPMLVFLLCNFVFIPFEEAKMQRQHSDPYTDYITRVRRWL